MIPGILLLAQLIVIPAGDQTVLDAATGFRVQVRTGSYQLQATEVTQEQYQQLMGVNPSHYKGPQRPVESVSWHDAIRYANRRSELERLAPCYDLSTGKRRPGCKGYRLPTSAEWEFAFGKQTGGQFRGTGYTDAQVLIKAEKQGTRGVGESLANAFGIHDMAGNVWEWCEDWFSPATALDSIRDPLGPPTGIARVIRGGSFLTGGTEWNRSLLNSQDPNRKSRFTGFRLARTVSPAPRAAAPDAPWLAQFQPNLRAASNPWGKSASWLSILGIPKLRKAVPSASLVRSYSDPTWNAQLIDLAIEPQFPTRILIAAPVRKPAGRLPVILVPYYDVDTPAGIDLGGKRLTLGGTRAFARLATQRGFLAVAVKWYGEADGEGYDEAVFHLAARHPGVTPMGKWIWDVQRIVDYLVTRPDVDASNIGIIGHSLGGKMALYAAAFEPRIKATVSSEPGISLKFSNYQDFWYLGKVIERLPPMADQHELIASMSPRPFLLIAGESADGDKSWPFLQSAQKAYPSKELVGMINHRSGHSPTEASVLLAMEWLERFLQ